MTKESDGMILMVFPLSQLKLKSNGTSLKNEIWRKLVCKGKFI